MEDLDGVVFIDIVYLLILSGFGGGINEVVVAVLVSVDRRNPPSFRTSGWDRGFVNRTSHTSSYGI